MQRRYFLTAFAAAGLFEAGCSRPASKTEGSGTEGSSGESGKTAVPAAEKSGEKQIDYCFELENAGNPVRVKESRQFHSGERFRFRVRSGFESHLYLLNRGPGENFWTVLFPSPKIEIKNPIPAGKVVTIPDQETGWLRIDQRAGNEQLVLIAATAPLQEFAVEGKQVSRDDFENRIDNIERLYRPTSSRRFEDDGWVKLFAAGPSDPLAIVLNMPLMHT
jgi:hypothetical protein